MSITRHETRARMSQVVMHGNVVYLAGQVGDSHTDSIADQTQQALNAIDGHLATAGTDKTKLLTATIWLADIRNFEEMNAVWDAWTAPDCAPSRACIEAKQAPPGWGVEIMVTAALD